MYTKSKQNVLGLKSLKFYVYWLNSSAAADMSKLCNIENLVVYMLSVSLKVLCILGHEF